MLAAGGVVVAECWPAKKYLAVCRGEAQCLVRGLAQATARQHTTEGCWDSGGERRRVEGAGSKAEVSVKSTSRPRKRRLGGASY
jgi:hypothetical protein